MQDDFDIEGNGKTMLGIIVRGSGFVLLIIGLLFSFMVVREVFKLYHDPQRIERFASAIEKGSNIDKSLNALRASAIPQNSTDETSSIAEYTMPEPGPKPDSVRVSYFVAWIIVLLLLLLMGHIALAAVKTGGELVLYDMQIKRFASMLIKESGKR